MNDKIEVFVDGGSRGNPGFSACAFVVFSDTKKIYEGGFFLGILTNNQAEYLGVVHALDWLVNNRVDSDAEIFLDSELVAFQMSGKYKIKNEGLKMLYEVAKNLEKKSNAQITYTAISRSENSRADELLNKILDHMTT